MQRQQSIRHSSVLKPSNSRAQSTTPADVQARGSFSFNEGSVVTLPPIPSASTPEPLSSGSSFSPALLHRKSLGSFIGLPEKLQHKDEVPDMTAWQAPKLRTESIINKMQVHTLSSPPQFTNPKKLSKLESHRLASQQIANKKESVLSKSLKRAKSTVSRSPARSLNATTNSATSTSKLGQTASGSPMGSPHRPIHHAVSFTPAKMPSTTTLDPVYYSPTRAGQMNVEGADFAKNEIAEFDEHYNERTAFADFVNQNKPRTLPNMVIKQFRHQICETSELVQLIRDSVPLENIEEEVKEMTHKTMYFPQFYAMLAKLLEHRGGEECFSPVEAQSLYDFFDHDGDGDLDFKELCNGFCLVMCEDGSLLTIMHRCLTLLNPHSVKDTRLSLLTRFELVLMADAIRRVSTLPSDRDRELLEVALHKMLNKFGCNKRGQFPLIEVRDYVSKTPIVKKAIQSFTVPREKHLYDSFISQFFRHTDAEEGEQAFRLMRSERANAAGRRRGSVNPNGATPAVSPTTSPTSTGLHPPSFSNNNSFALESGDSGQKGLTPRLNSSSEGTRNPNSITIGGNNALLGASNTTAPKPQTKSRDKVLNERPVEEPGNPTFFTLKGVLYRKLEGEAAVPYWVEGMPKKIAYSGEEGSKRSTRSQSPIQDDE